MFSTSKNYRSSYTNSSLMVFSDSDQDKLDILEYVKGKAGIYMWSNKLNGKKYVGSSPSRGSPVKSEFYIELIEWYEM